jgi:hypothetical protein
LERDLKAIRKAREALGDKAPVFKGQGRPRREEDNTNVLGKRRHDGERKFPQRGRETSGSDTDDSVRRLPMPEDTPPPIPREFRRNFKNSERAPDTQLPQKPSGPAEIKTTYESAPQLRDLRKEAIGRFVPDVVRRKQEAAKGGTTGQLVEPELMDQLEAEGYIKKGSEAPKAPEHNGAPVEDEIQAQRLAEEERRFLEELEMQDADEPVHTDKKQPPHSNRHVEIEEVEDEDA